MGIKQLFSIIKEEAPAAIKEGEIKNQFGRKVAIVSDNRLFLPFSMNILEENILISLRSGCVRYFLTEWAPWYLFDTNIAIQLNEHLQLPYRGSIRRSTTHE